MAGIPMYYGIPTSGEVEAKMARDKMDVLKTQQAEIELDELIRGKKILAEQAAKEKLAQLTSNKIAPPAIDQTPQAAVPSTKPTPAQDMVTPTLNAYESTTTPSGEVSPMPSFMKGPDTEARVKEPTLDETKPAEAQPTEAQPAEAPKEKVAIEGYREPQQEAAPQQQVQEEAPQTPITKVQKANLDYKEAFDQVEAAYKTADLFKQNGLLLQYQKQLKVAQDLETSRSMAQERRIKATKDLFDVTGGIAQSYVEIAKNTDDPVALNRAWNSALLMMESNGIPTGNLKNIINPAERLQVAQQYATSSVEASAKLKLEMEMIKEKGRNDRTQKMLDVRQDLADKRLRQTARNQEAIQLRFEASMDLRERQFALNKATKIISQAKEDRRQLNTEIDDLNYRLTGLREGRIYVDRSGNKLTKESRIQEIEDIQKDINKMTSQRDDLTDEIEGYEIKFKDIGTKAKAKEEPAPATETAPSNAKVPTAERLAKVQEYVKQYPDQAATIKANWEKEYPNVKFEDALKGKVTVTNPDYKGNVKFEALTIAQLEDYIKRYPKDENIDYIKKLIEAKRAAEKTASSKSIGR